MVICPVQLGTKVTSKKTGFPGFGIVVRIELADFYISMATQGSMDLSCFHTWNKLYPNWTQKPLFMVYFDEERKPLTMEEFKNSRVVSQWHDTFEYELQEQYNNIPNTKILMFPMDDLEVME